MQNLRAFTRTDFVGMVTMAWPDRPHGDAVWGKDLSENGMFLQSTSPFRVGDRIQLHFTLDGGEVRVEEAEVRWIRKFEPVSVDGSLPGIGVHFVSMSEACRAVLCGYIASKQMKTPARPVAEIASTMRMFAAPSGPRPQSVSLPPQTPVTVSQAEPQMSAPSVPPLTLLSNPPAANWSGWRFDRVNVAPGGPPVTSSTPAPAVEPPAPPMMIFDPGQNSAAQPLAKFEEATLDESDITLKTNTRPVFTGDDVTAPPHPAGDVSQSMPPAPRVSLERERPVIVRMDAVENTHETAKWSFGESEARPPRAVPKVPLADDDVEPSEPYQLTSEMAGRALADRESDEHSGPMMAANDDGLSDEELAALRTQKRGGGFWPKALMVTIGAGLGIWMGVPSSGDTAGQSGEVAAIGSHVAAPQPVADAERGLDTPSRLERTLSTAAAEEPAAVVAPEAKATPTLAKAAAPVEKPKPVRQGTLAHVVAPTPQPAKAVRVARATNLITAKPGSASVRISGGEIVSVFGLEGPARVVVDLEGAKFPGFVTENVNAHGVKRLRVGKPDGKRMRVVIELDGDTRPRGIMADKADGALSVRWR